VNALIQNNKGMACQLIAIAYDTGERYNRKQIYALDIAGAITAVKAIWATTCTGGPMKTFGINENYNQFRGDKEAGYRSFVSQPLPGVTHYHIVPEPRPESEYFVLTSLTSESRERGLYDLLRLYTPHPVLPGWREPLFELGMSRDYGLITSLKTAGMEWAYEVSSTGWDTLIDNAIKNRRIHVSEVLHG
jgi:hypothetical protein